MLLWVSRQRAHCLRMDIKANFHTIWPEWWAKNYQQVAYCQADETRLFGSFLIGKYFKERRRKPLSKSYSFYRGLSLAVVMDASSKMLQRPSCPSPPSFFVAYLFLFTSSMSKNFSTNWEREKRLGHNDIRDDVSSLSWGRHVLVCCR